MTVISVCGRVRHIRPLPSLSTTASVPVSATAKLAPLIATRARRNRSRRCARAAMASLRGSSVSAGVDARHGAQEDLADLGPVLVDRRHQDVARLVVAELHDELGQVGLVRGDAGGLERLVQADLLGGHRLDLDHLVGAGGLHQPGDDLVGLVGVAGPVHRAAAGGDLLLQRDQVLVEPGHRGGLDRPAGLRAARAQSGTSPTTAARLPRMVAVACPRLARSWPSRSASRAASGNERSPRRWPTPAGRRREPEERPAVIGPPPAMVSRTGHRATAAPWTGAGSRLPPSRRGSRPGARCGCPSAAGRARRRCA